MSEMVEIIASVLLLIGGFLSRYGFNSIVVDVCWYGALVVLFVSGVVGWMRVINYPPIRILAVSLLFIGIVIMAFESGEAGLGVAGMRG